MQRDRRSWAACNGGVRASLLCYGDCSFRRLPRPVGERPTGSRKSAQVLAPHRALDRRWVERLPMAPIRDLFLLAVVLRAPRPHLYVVAELPGACAPCPQGPSRGCALNQRQLVCDDSDLQLHHHSLSVLALPRMVAARLTVRFSPIVRQRSPRERSVRRRRPAIHRFSVPTVLKSSARRARPW